MAPVCHIIVTIKLNNKGILLSPWTVCMNSNIPPVQDQVQSVPQKSTNVHVATPKFFMPVFLTIIIATLIYIAIQVNTDLKPASSI